MIDGLTDSAVAHVWHEAGRALQLVTGHPFPVPHWEDATAEQREFTEAAVKAYVGGDDASQVHDIWIEVKQAHGWVYGPVEDPEKKTHPCLVPYDQLPPEEKVKDYLFIAVIEVMMGDY